jgi:pimeloyl-ACP methyl ester carboxylesterase
LFLHGIGNSGRTWEHVVDQLPADVNVIIVDLLGFGDSPQPAWARYDAATQAKAVAKTLWQLRLTHRVIIVGHSMGTLVAVEFARRYPALVRSLVLFSPPIYSLDTRDKRRFLVRDAQLRRIYDLMARRPTAVGAIMRLGARYKLLNPDMDVERLNLTIYAQALRANIINQTTFRDVVKLKKPIAILYGTLDPVVIGATLRELRKKSGYITVQRFVGGHEIVRGYVDRAASLITQVVDETIGYNKK